LLDCVVGELRQAGQHISGLGQGRGGQQCQRRRDVGEKVGVGLRRDGGVGELGTMNVNRT
jgi:hypothetical protein